MERKFQIGPWLVHPSLNTISRGGNNVHLEPKVMEVLVCLIESAGETVPKESLIQRVWTDTFVTDDVLIRAISELRRAFEDDAKESRVIQTIPKRGYRLVAPVTGARGKAEVVPPVTESSQLGDQHPGDRVAVFPLANPDGSPDMEYLLSGIPGSIIRGLSPLPGLTVVAGGIVPGNGNQGGNAQAFGRKFSVGTALLGRLLQRRTRLRLQVDLVDTKTGQELWADQYDRDFSELFLVQDDIVKEVCQQLRVNLAGQESHLNKRYTENTDAYELYLRGRHCFESRNVEGFKKAIDYFNGAIRLDPNYALAYADLAAALYLPGYYGLVRAEESFPRARSAAEKALALDDTLPQAYEALATLNLFDWKWEAGEALYRRCLEINPNHSLSHYHYALCLSELGRFQEAITEATEAQIRDPLSAPINACLAWTFWASRQPEKALRQSLIATELDPHSMFARVTAGVSYEQNGMYKEAISEFQEAFDRNGASIFLGFQGHAFARSGDTSSAWRIVQKLEALSNERHVAPSHLAIVYAGLNEKDLAIQSLQAACQNRDSFLVFINMLPQYDNLRSDSRFQDLLRRMNFLA
jgi:DNA-binding winged helix-turn-helix (wHTH) protein